MLDTLESFKIQAPSLKITQLANQTTDLPSARRCVSFHGRGKAGDSERSNRIE